MDPTEIKLREYLDTVLDDLNYKPRDVVVKPISSDGANFTSGLFNVTVTSPGKETLHLFSKVANVGENVRGAMGCTEMFSNERLVYEDIQNVFNRLQTKYSIPEKDRLIFAKYYGSDLSPGCEVFILEDLIEKGFRVYDRFDTLNWDHMSENIKALAKFHALSMALEKENPEIFEKVPKKSCTADGIIEMVKDKAEFFLEGLSEDHKTKIRNFYTKFGYLDLVLDHFNRYGKDVIVHGDYRPSNVMYKQEVKNLTVIPVDYQTIRVGCTMSDLMYFVTTATDGEFRRKHFEQLMDLYHEQLSSRLAALGMDVNDVYPRAQFDKELKKMLPGMLMIAFVLYRFGLAAPDDAPQMSGGDAELSNFLVGASEKSIERLTELIEDFIRWNIL